MARTDAGSADPRTGGEDRGVLSAAGGAPRIALVLSGGGARAAYQVGVLRRIGRHRPRAPLRIVTGVSAGAINSTFLAGHPGPLAQSADELADHWCSLDTSRVFRTDFLTLFFNAVRWILSLGSGGWRVSPHVRGLVDTQPLGGFLRGVLPAGGIERNLESGRLWAAAVSATSYQTGQGITFVQCGPQVKMWERVRRRSLRTELTSDHVMASAALPLLFPAVRVGSEFFGDGSLRQSNPLAPAVHLGADRILAISSRYAMTGREARTRRVEGYPPPAQVIGLLFNSMFLDSLDADAARLSRINHLIGRVPEDRRAELPLRRIELLVLRPSRDLGRLAAEYERQLPRAVRFLTRGLGTRRSRTADFVSYLLFETEYLQRLIETGEEDAERQWPQIARFLGEPVASSSEVRPASASRAESSA